MTEMLQTPAGMHALLTIGMFVLAYLFVSGRRTWYVCASVFYVNLVLSVSYLVIDRMTGQGFNEAALYYIINAWADVGMLWEFTEFKLGLAGLILGTLAFIWVVRKLPLPRLGGLSKLSQIVIVGFTGVAATYTAPLAADVRYTLDVSGALREDRVGLPAVLTQATPLAISKIPDGQSKKNLIVIYAESLESAFFDDRVFPGLLPRLNALALKGVRFDRINSSPMSDWTIAGMIATQCGVPLSSHRLRNEEDDFGKFGHASSCLAQHLSANGYHKVYMGGASRLFAGKGEFYEIMGFEEILGLEELAVQGKPQSKWGVFDDDLFPQVVAKVRTLRERHQPFALVGLTLDTHPPMGHPTPTCEAKAIRYEGGENKHLNAVRCADWLITDMLQQLIDENLKDSTIVLLSDHVMMGSRATDAIKQRGAQRFNHMVIWDKDLTPSIVSRHAAQFDEGVTIWQALTGQSIRMGFGQSMLDSTPNLTERFGQAAFDESVHAWRVSSWTQH